MVPISFLEFPKTTGSAAKPWFASFNLHRKMQLGSSGPKLPTTDLQEDASKDSTRQEKKVHYVYCTIQKNTMTPTKDTYGALEQAYDYFNRNLFEGRLPPCLLTLQRKGKSFGFFSPGRFKAESEESDELAMNPKRFADRTLAETLSTLAHEMTHVEQEHFGKPGRRGYHNKAWGELMRRIGLEPSNTGKPGGKKTGQQMTHYVIAGGAFERVSNRLIAGGFKIRWGEGDGAAGEPEGKAGGEPEQDKSNRIRFGCSGCNAKAWGKPSLKIICGKCRLDMLAS